MATFGESENPIFDKVNVNEGVKPLIIEKIVPIDNTPNVRIENSDTRRKITSIAVGIGAILGTVVTVDLATPAFDLSAYTDPIIAGFLYITSFYGIVVTLPNTPKRNG